MNADIIHKKISLAWFIFCVGTTTWLHKQKLTSKRERVGGRESELIKKRRRKKKEGKKKLNKITIEGKGRGIKQHRKKEEIWHPPLPKINTLFLKGIMLI
eukprot:TRINITY_DN511_c0_g1_i1.p2 TRINITY_DN511_c0_g1~~TRINITY_DN511_c0_g1_i1.p2  ORF type:complete len:100 (-),score=19.00 TRINITY_DN511_c0_g1_i1:511-810(-)